MPSEMTGSRLRLRPVMPEDAAFIHGLRTDPAYNTHLSPVTGTVDDQRAWIEAYKVREAAGEEIYYVIERRDGVPCGVVRLYDITRTASPGAAGSSTRTSRAARRWKARCCPSPPGSRGWASRGRISTCDGTTKGPSRSIAALA